MSGICDVPHTYRNTCRFRLVRSSSRRVAVSISAPYSIGIRFIGLKSIKFEIENVCEIHLLHLVLRLSSCLLSIIRPNPFFNFRFCPSAELFLPTSVSIFAKVSWCVLLSGVYGVS